MSIGKESSSIWCFVGMNREKKQTVAITRTFLCHEYQHRNKLKRRKEEADGFTQKEQPEK